MTIENQTKQCPPCGRALPLTSFHRNKARRDGRSSYCIDCQKVHSSRHYKANKQAYFDRNKLVRKRQRQRLLALKQTSPCTDCGGFFHPHIMEFDHPENVEKKFSLGRYGSKSDKQIREEIAKCDLVCANCHKMRTFTRIEAKRALDPVLNIST